MHSLLKHIRLLLIAVTALAMSAGLAFAAAPPDASTGLANAAAHAGKTVPVAGGDVTLGEDDEDVETDEDTDDLEDGDEAEVEGAEDEAVDDVADVEDVEDAADAADHCSTDPSLLAPEDLDAMNHGSIACWAAHQTEWPEWFSNHGAFVRCWAHQGKTGAASCTEDPSASEGTVEEPTGDELQVSHGKGHGKGQGKAKNKNKHQE